MNTVTASGEVLKIYQTGDRPILVLCSDGYHYICKYKQPGPSANKLASELIGSQFAKLWGIATPYTCLVENDPIIWDDAGISHDPIAPLLGSRRMENTIDLSNYNCDQVLTSWTTKNQLLTIALFDLWLANEDRTSNNYNLLYDLRSDTIVSIDYGGIFNTIILGAPIFQLNAEDSIISSDLFDRLNKAGIEYSRTTFLRLVSKCKAAVPEILESIPREWNINTLLFEKKIAEVFNMNWLSDTWNNFISLINR